MAFVDVPADRWSRRYIETAVALGLLKGDPNGRFRPTDPITREEIAVLAVRLAENDLALRRWASLRLRSQVAPAVIHIRAGFMGEAVGAGVVIHPMGFAVTCHHVVANYKRGEAGHLLDCRWPDWEPGRAGRWDLNVLVEAPEHDLALVKIVWPTYDVAFPWLKLAATREEPAEPVVMLGSPAGIQGWESHGLVARRDIVAQTYQVPQELVCISGAINPGNSGGALVRAADATLLGIVDAKLVDVAIEGMGFAVPIHRVAELLQQAGVTQP